MSITLDSIKAKMVGKTFGKLTILNYVGKSERGDNLWKCKCDCGTIVVNRTSAVDKPFSACPDCKRKAGSKAEYYRTYLLSQVFGRLKVVKYAGKNKHQNSTWLCSCQCGNEVVVKASSLITGVTQSCGCYGRERASQANTKHGLHDHPLYAIWWAMKQRCYNPKHEAYPDYGGRGITICDDWHYDFLSFYRWAMSRGYQSNLTIDRRDNNDNYEPGNCWWTTPENQNQNKRSNRITAANVAEIRNDTRTHGAIASAYGVDESTISRIKARTTWKNVA